MLNESIFITYSGLFMALISSVPDFALAPLALLLEASHLGLKGGKIDCCPVFGKLRLLCLEILLAVVGNLSILINISNC